MVKLVFIKYAFLLVKDDDCDSDAENEQNHDPSVEEFLQQQDTAVIYPEAPEEDQRQGTPEASGHDENGKWNFTIVFVFILKGLFLLFYSRNLLSYYREHFWKPKLIEGGYRN